MEYLKLTFNFLKHNKIKMLLYSIIPALGFACLYNPGIIIRYFKHYNKPNLMGFGEIYDAINNFSHMGGLWWLAMIIVLTFGVASLGAMAGSVQRRMRYGIEYRNSFGNLWNKINSFFIPVLLSVVSFMLIMQVYFLLLSMFCFIWLKLHNEVVGMTLSILTLILLASGVLVCTSIFSTILPNMAIKGYSFFKAVQMGVTETMSHIGKILWSLALPTVLMLVPVFLVNLFEYPGCWIVNYLFSVMFYLVAFTMGVPLSYTIFFDLNDMKREDLNTYKEWGLK